MLRMLAVASVEPQRPRSGVSMPMKRMCSPVSMTIVSPSSTSVTIDVAAGASGALGAAVVAGGSVLGGGGGTVVGGSVGATVVGGAAVVGASGAGAVEVVGAAGGGSWVVAGASTVWTELEPPLGATRPTTTRAVTAPTLMRTQRRRHHGPLGFGAAGADVGGAQLLPSTASFPQNVPNDYKTDGPLRGDAPAVVSSVTHSAAAFAPTSMGRSARRLRARRAAAARPWCGGSVVVRHERRRASDLGV